MATRILLTFLLLAALPAMAEDIPGALDVSARYRATGGTDQPGLTLTATRSVSGVVVTIEQIDGPVTTVKVGSLKAGESRKVSVRQEPGRAYYRAEVAYSGQVKPYEITWSSAVAQQFEISVKGEDVDLSAGRIALAITGKAHRVELKMTGEDGAILFKRELRLDSPSGRPDSLDFQPPTAIVTHVEITAYDENDFAKAVEFTPVVVDVPHDEVNFESGKSAVLPAEEPKLDRALAAIHEALEKLGRQVKLRLYVGGYTDTVGGREYNQGLSEARAGSLAAWLVSHGLKVAVCSQGFGEEVLAVQTPDETDEPKNRRSLFVLAGQSPSMNSFPRGNWRCR
jgi:outer membrane protein OmpA-like peptidoglycan-associated protein